MVSPLLLLIAIAKKSHTTHRQGLTKMDKSLTFRDMITVRAAGIQGYKGLMETMGVLAPPLLLRHGLDPTALDDPEALLSLQSVVNLLEESAEVTRCPDFGLRLAGGYDSGILGVVALVIQNAPTVRQAIADLSKYLRFHSPGFEVTLDERSLKFSDCVALRFEVCLPVFVAQRQTVDACVAYMFKFLRTILGDLFRVRGVSLPHSPASLESSYRSFFHTYIFFEESYAALHIPRDILDRSLKSINPAVRKLALDHLGKSLPPESSPLSQRVRQALIHTLGVNRGTKAEIAKLLGIHPRTLQRRLDHEGVSFELIRDEVYKNATLRYLRETQVPLKQLAGALGFSEQSALTRSCKRWFGIPPSEIRARLTPP
ncbi:TPA: AraC family transcriptional regulator ligand-binding domain-containing protein [Pseudomonas aeruginosa]|nr:AraC family transcriptional regulator ligand-binding domain-containing protein [Pseudomonas aeruginosa]